MELWKISWKTSAGRSVQSNCNGWSKWCWGPEWNSRKTRSEINRQKNRSETLWMMHQQERKRMGGQWGEGAQNTSSWKKEKGVHLGVQVMVIDILFWGQRREWDSSDSGTNVGPRNRTPRCFYLENTEKSIWPCPESREKEMLMSRCVKEKERDWCL